MTPHSCRWHLLARFAGAVVWSSFTLPGYAQGANAPAASAPIALSPFEVVDDKDVGYLAQNTLGGTRLNTSLKDTAASISVMTAEFLSDIAATTVLEAMKYGVNAHEDADDNSTNFNAENYNQSFGNIRIRGLPGATRTQDYFGRLYESDLYNVERIDQARGPNSILFGLGSAAGVINSSTKQANFQRTFTTLTGRYDSWNLGYRSSLDRNQVLVPGRVGLRLNFLKTQEAHWRDYGHNDQERFSLAAKIKLSDRVSLRADFEQSRQDRYRPRTSLGVDAVTYWQQQGSPLYDGFRRSNANPADDLPASQMIAPSAATAPAGVVNRGWSFFSAAS